MTKDLLLKAIADTRCELWYLRGLQTDNRKEQMACMMRLSDLCHQYNIVYFLKIGHYESKEDIA